MKTQQNTFDTAISRFPAKVQADLLHALSEGALIPSELVLQCLNELNIEIETFMIQLLPVAAAYARAPISNFHVGAVALGMPPASLADGPGNLYLGANMEFYGEALSFCVHGEQSAVNNAWLNGEIGLQSLAINAAPCGYCRQFLYELTTATKGFKILLKTGHDSDDDSYTIQPLNHYLPDAFGPQDLGVKGGLMESGSHNLIIFNQSEVSNQSKASKQSEMLNESETAKEALASANASYSPYTNSYSGVALLDEHGAIFSGRYAENAAYNPSLSPLESALAFMAMSLPAQAALTITEAVLVETQGKVSQKEVTETVLRSISPSVSLRCYQAE